MFDADAWIKGALSSLPIPMSRDPMLTAEKGLDWLVWRQTGEQNRYASGQIVSRRVNLTLTLACLESSNHQQLAADIVAMLRAYQHDNGKQRCAFTRIGGDSWDSTIARRSVIIFLGIRGDL